MTPFPTLAVSKQGTLESLHYPLYKVDRDGYWVVFERAVLMVRTGWLFYWTPDMKGYEDARLSALALNPCGRIEVIAALDNEVTNLNQITKNL